MKRRRWLGAAAATVATGLAVYGFSREAPEQEEAIDTSHVVCELEVRAAVRVESIRGQLRLAQADLKGSRGLVEPVRLVHRLQALAEAEAAAHRALETLNEVGRPPPWSARMGPPPSPVLVVSVGDGPPTTEALTATLSAVERTWAPHLQWASRVRPTTCEAQPDFCSFASALLRLAADDCQAMAPVLSDGGDASEPPALELGSRLARRCGDLAWTGSLLSDLSRLTFSSIERRGYTESYRCHGASPSRSLRDRMAAVSSVLDAFEGPARHLADHCRITPPDFSACDPATLFPPEADRPE